VAATCDRLLGSADVRALFDEFWNLLLEQMPGHGFPRVSAALELSTRTEAEPRFHLHAFCSRQGCHDTRARGRALWDALRFRGCRAAHVVPCLPGRGHTHGERGETQGHYYLQAPKVGSALRRTTWPYGQDWQVRAPMVMALWRARKLTHEAARRELVGCRDRAHVHLSEVDKLEREEYALHWRLAAPAVRGQSALRPWKPPTPLESEWLAQYAAGDPAAEALRRFRLLVLDGPSRTGKTERACAYFGVEHTLVVNCQGVAAPCLHQWLSGRYRAVVFDEADWRLVWGNRQLMQAGVHPVLLGQSTCNEHAYSVHVFRAPMVVTSNAFWADCPSGPERDWIMANTLYVRVLQPMWTQTPPVSPESPP
jgi:hypothetical protein